MAATRQVKVDLLLDSDSYRKGVLASERATNKFNRQLKNTKGNPFRSLTRGAIGAAAGIVSVAGAYSLVRGAIDQTVTLAKATRTLQRSTGLAAEDASQLAAVLQVRGVQAVAAGRAFTALARQTRAAADGSKTAAGAFKELGVSQQAIRSGDVNQILVQAADGFKKLGDGQAKAAIAQQLFGRGAKDIIPIMEGGSKALRGQLDIAPKLSQAQVAMSLMAIGAQHKMRLAMMALQIFIGTELMPTITKVATAVGKFVIEFRNGTGAGGRFKEQLKQIGAVLWAVGKVLKEHPGLLIAIAAAYVALKIASIFNTFMTAFGSVAKFAAAGAIRGRAFSAALKIASIFASIFNRLIIAFGSVAKFAAAGTVRGGAFGAAFQIGAFIGLAALTAFLGFKLGRKLGDQIAAGIKADNTAKAAAKLKVVEAANAAAAKKRLFYDAGTGLSINLGKGVQKAGPAIKAKTLNAVLDANFAAASKKAQFENTGRSLGNALAQGIGSTVGNAVAALVGQLNRLADRANEVKDKVSAKKGSVQKGGIPEQFKFLSPVQKGGGFESPLAPGFAGLDPQLAEAESQRTVAEARLEKVRAEADKKGKTRSKAEIKRIQDAQAAVNLAAVDVKKLGAAITRRDVLSGLANQFAGFVSQAVDKMAAGLQEIAQGIQTKANELAATTRDTALGRLDEATGDSPEAVRLRELRAEQDRLNKSREDDTYATDREALEVQLARAVRNNNRRGQAELNAQILALDTARGDVLRNREETALSASLEAQRKNANDTFDVQTTAAQAAFDEQTRLDALAVTNFQTNLDTNLNALLQNLANRKVGYATFATAVQKILADAGIGGAPSGIVGADSSPFTPSPSDEAGLGDNAPGGGGLTKAQQIRLKIRKLKDKKKTYTATGIGKLLNPDATQVEVWNAIGKKSPFEGYKIANKASGGMLTPGQLTLVGETGPELIVGGKVNSATRTNRMGKLSGMTINVNATGAAANDPVILARELGWQLATR